MVATPYIMSTALDTYAKYVCDKMEAPEKPLPMTPQIASAAKTKNLQC